MTTQINKKNLRPNPTKTRSQSFVKFGLIVSLGLATANPAPLLASQSNNHQQQATTDKVAASTQKSAGAFSGSHFEQAQSPFPDGNYLYGQSSEPETIGQEYLVFNVERGKVVGAIYLPRSEFSCFSGSLNREQMNVSIVDPYTNNTYPYSIAVEDTASVATASQNIPYSLGLVGYQRIDEISDNDRRLLNTCSNSF